MQAYAGTMAADQVAEQTVDSAHPTMQAQAKATVPGATASVWCGVIGFFLFGFILGPAAIANAAKAKTALAEHPDRYTGGGLATTGMVLGVIDILGAVFGLVVMLSQ